MVLLHRTMWRLYNNMGNVEKNMGETKKAKKAFREVLNIHPKHLVASYSAVDLIDIARVDVDIVAGTVDM